MKSGVVMIENAKPSGKKKPTKIKKQYVGGLK